VELITHSDVFDLNSWAKNVMQEETVSVLYIVGCQCLNAVLGPDLQNFVK